MLAQVELESPAIFVHSVNEHPTAFVSTLRGTGRSPVGQPEWADRGLMT